MRAILVLSGRSSTSPALLPFYGRLYFNISTLQQINGPVILRHYPHLDGGSVAKMAKSTSGDVTVVALWLFFFFFFNLLKYCSIGSFLCQLIDNDIEFFSPPKSELRVMMLVSYISFHQSQANVKGRSFGRSHKRTILHFIVFNSAL